MLPFFSKYEPRCTRVARNTNDPVWIHNFTFENFVINSKELEVAVFDYLQGRTAFIGEVGSYFGEKITASMDSIKL